MRCETSRAQIQDWLDTPGAPSMPDAIRDHIRDCSDCRGFIKRWNSIEVGLMAMREQAPRPSPDFSQALHARLRSVPHRERVRIPVKWSFAVAGASSVAALVMLAMYLTGAKHGAAPSSPGATYANNRASGSSLPDSGSSFSSLPLANTNR